MTAPFGAERRAAWLRLLVWAAAFLALGAATALMLLARHRLDKAHVALVYLMLVLGGSAAGGRWLGLTMAAAAFVAFDSLFLPPYNTLVVANPLDWLVLLAFLVTSVVAAQLLTRAQQRAEDARRRADEVERFARLGSETLNVARAEDALHAIAAVIRATLDVDRCDIYVRDDDSAGPRLAARVTDPRRDPVDAEPPRLDGRSLVAWVHSHGIAASERADGTLHVPVDANPDAPVGWTELAGARTILVPLRVRTRTVGSLLIMAERGLVLAAEQQVFLDALTYYAALGIERARLAADAASVEAMREADRLKNALLATVSHDLRTPLTTIKALAHAVTEEGAAPGDRRASSIEEEADRLTAFVADLLDLSRLTGGALRLAPAVNTAEDLIGAAAARAAGVLGDHPLSIVHDPDAPVLTGYFDFVHALRIVVNLLENAAKYSPSGTAIELGARQDGDRLVFTVADRGSGVPYSERERIFEPFYRPAGVPADIRGAGLGLAIARGLAAAQEGTLTYEARPGGGSLFHLTLPAASDRPA